MDINLIKQHRVEKIESLLLGTIDKDIQKLQGLCEQVGFNDDERSRIQEVLEYAQAKNYGDHPLLKYYVSHPIRVGSLVLEWQLNNNVKDLDFLIAALIHNAIEKKLMSTTELEQDYGPWIAHVIQTITVDREKQREDGFTQEYYQRVYTLEKRGRLLKAFDKFDNIYAICLNPDQKTREDYLAEIEQYISPIINEYSDHLSEYFKELIASTRKMDYLDKNHFITDCQQSSP